MTATLLYDGACGPCSAFARWVKAADVRGRIEVRRLEEPEMERRYGRRLGERYMESFHLDTGRGVASGAEALPDLLALFPGGLLWGPAARLPPVRGALAAGYRAMSRLRDRAACGRAAAGRPGAF
ncbi:MAG: DCC1-like thiol-disulfide oxidoreductase family protein [Halobacteria archaeon]